MPFGMGVPKTFSAPRREPRVPMELGVQIAGHPRLPGTEATFTENVSSKGARVISARRWKKGDSLVISTLTGSFQSTARVAYCEYVPQAGFAVGLEFPEANSSWMLGAPPKPRN
jgi:hypothetical protein